jgi:hypothetical protein
MSVSQEAVLGPDTSTNRLTRDLLRFLGSSAGSQIVAWQLHEAGHYLAGMVLGGDQTFRLTAVQYHGSLTGLEQLFLHASGVVATLVIAMVALIYLVRSTPQPALLLVSFVYANAFLRVQPMLPALFGGSIRYQDEYYMATSVGVSPQLVGLVSLVTFGSIFLTAIYHSGSHKLLKLILFIMASGMSVVIMNALSRSLF